MTTSASRSSAARIPSFRDVTLRDGLQLTGKLLPTEKKVALARELLALGVESIEIGAMARPDLVPPMANTLEVIQALTPTELERCWVWVATPRSAERALAAGARNLQYCLSVSDAHNQANVGRSTEDSVAAMPAAADAVRAAGGRIQLTLATSFTCPFEGAIAEERVLAIVDDPRTAAASSVAICDTLGQAVPPQVSSLVGRVADALAARDAPTELLFHGHDTWGLGVANAFAAVDAGATALDGALAGLGGCPFAPGASGNTATEDLLFAIRPSWFDPTVFARLAALGDTLVTDVDERNASAAVHAGRVTPGRVFPWALVDGADAVAVAVAEGSAGADRSAVGDRPAASADRP